MGCSGSKKQEAEANSDPANGKKDKDKAAQGKDKAGGVGHTSGKLLDKYSLGKVLGQGAFGVVYKCKKKGTDEEYAVKMIDQVETPLAEIKREAKMLERLNHPTVIKLHDVYYEKVFVCMVLDYYRGGDMIQGMMAHWKSKGMIPISNVKSLSKQMHAACAWVHAQGCVHRDVKGDNFMMDRPNVETPNQRLYLSDFGTVIDFDGMRITQKCGTKNYWPPEFFALNYGIKVDCWAVGVVMFGLVSGKFPFKGEEDVKSKQLSIPKRCPADGQQLIQGLLERNEEKRLTCEKALQSKFLVDQTVPALEEKDQGGPAEGVDIKADGANAGVAQRRAELVDRLQKAEEGPKRRNKQIATSKQYEVTDPGTERTMVFGWHAPATTKSLVAAFDKAKAVPVHDMANREVSDVSVTQLLQDHNVSVSGFGKGQAKSFSQFVTEIQNGDCRLLLDATQHKVLVRAVDMVMLKISYGKGDKKRVLVEKAKVSLPGGIQHPQENALQTAQRLKAELLGCQEAQVKWDTAGIEAYEESEKSTQYPGITTVYQKEIIEGELTTSDAKVLNKLGLSSGAMKFDFNVGGVNRTFEWMEPQATAKAGIIVKAPENQDFSALVYPPIGLEEEELQAFLKKNDVKTDQWGQGTFKSLEEFSEELMKGESTLIKQANGKVARLVDIVVLHLTRSDSKEVLLEDQEKYKGSTQTLIRLPAVKRRSDEHQYYTARRMVAKYLACDENQVEISTEVKVIEEEQESKSYQGLASIYRKRYMKAALHAD